MKNLSLGVAATCYLRIWETIHTFQFLERCHGFGAAGIQAPVNGDPLLIRRRAEELGMYFEAMIQLPKGDDTQQFQKSLQGAKAAGAIALRAACLGTRRYETFNSLESWNTHVTQARRSLESALPLLEKYRIPLGIENHKDWTSDELVSLLRDYSSEYLGVCLDFGNNITMLDHPLDTIQKLAPYAVSTHVKDVAADTYDHGILLSEVLLGSGHIDLNHAINAIHRARPTTKMTLEMITRDPLEVPMLNDSYWATFPEKRASDLAKTLRFVNEHKTAEPLPKASHMNEDQNIIECLRLWDRQQI